METILSISLLITSLINGNIQSHAPANHNLLVGKNNCDQPSQLTNCLGEINLDGKSSWKNYQGNIIEQELQSKKDTCFAISFISTIRTWNFTDLRVNYPDQEHLTFTPSITGRLSFLFKGKLFVGLGILIGNYKQSNEYENIKNFDYWYPNAYGIVLQQQGKFTSTTFEAGFALKHTRKMDLIIAGTLSQHRFRHNEYRNIFLTQKGAIVDNNVFALNKYYNNFSYGLNVHFRYYLHPRWALYINSGLLILNHRSGLPRFENEDPKITLIFNEIGISYKLMTK
jgi:hypothetical protein